MVIVELPKEEAHLSLVLLVQMEVLMIMINNEQQVLNAWHVWSGSLIWGFPII